MKNDESWEQLAKYFAGELSKEENKKMESWIKEDPDREEEMNRLYELWKETENLANSLDVDEAWMKLSGNIDAFEKKRMEFTSRVSGSDLFHKIPPSNHGTKKIRKPGTVWRRALLVAAAVLIVTLAGTFSYQFNLQNEPAELVETKNRVFITRDGERATYVLSDGSKVMLHADSRLEIPDDYNTTDRELFLEGEAYFEVTHDGERPFIVRSEHAYTRVLGTRFLVQAWPESNARVEVVVSDGKVAFGDSRQSNSEVEKEVLITKNRMGILANGQEPEVSEVTDLNWYMGWTEGRLEFENRPLSEVLPRLERWYDIDIQVEEEQIREKKITAEIDYSQSMSEVLQGIALTLELEVERADRTFIFRSPE